jgi:L-ascorbate metabolism protein UlaG (beta-lactamase superfamily)
MRLTWYGHSAFRVEFDGTALLIDPFLTGNPKWDGGWEGPAEGISAVLLTHGHDDHLGDALPIAKATGAMLVGAAEICFWANAQGIENINPGNHGGTIDCGAFTVTFVNALHSSSSRAGGETVYMGNPLGLVVRPKGGRALYHMGDTGLFGDMALIAELYEPAVGIVPIGDRFTMGAREAAYACRKFFRFDTVVPCHFGTFPMIDATADRFLAEMGPLANIVRVPEIGVPFDV